MKENTNNFNKIMILLASQLDCNVKSPFLVLAILGESENKNKNPNKQIISSLKYIQCVQNNNQVITNIFEK